MYFKIATETNHLTNIVANNYDDALTIAQELYPNIPDFEFLISEITHEEFHVPRHSN